MCDCEVAEDEREATELELVLWKAEAVDEDEEVCCGWVNGGGRCCLDCLESIGSLEERLWFWNFRFDVVVGGSSSVL